MTKGAGSVLLAPFVFPGAELLPRSSPVGSVTSTVSVALSEADTTARRRERKRIRAQHCVSSGGDGDSGGALAGAE